MGMEPFVRNFIRASLFWFGGGILLGVAMAWWPAQTLAFRPAHAHAHLLGFVSMMIFGVAYHVIPRFSGTPLTSRRLAGLHVWVANAGLAGMVGGWMVRVWQRDLGGALLGVGGALTAVGAFLFIYNIWTTLGPIRRPAMAVPAAGMARGTPASPVMPGTGAPSGTGATAGTAGPAGASRAAGLQARRGAVPSSEAAEKNGASGR